MFIYITANAFNISKQSLNFLFSYSSVTEFKVDQHYVVLFLSNYK